MLDGIITGAGAGIVARLFAEYQADKAYKRERRAMREAQNNEQYKSITEAGKEYGAKSTIYHWMKRGLVIAFVANFFVFFWYLAMNMNIIPYVMKMYGGKFLFGGNETPNIFATMIWINISAVSASITYYLSGRPKERVL